MTKKKEDEERVRKAYSPKGTIGQKHISFRIDLDNLRELENKPNKGRFINDAIRAYINK